MEPTSTAPRRRRYDPARRERIAAAAIRVVARDGIEGLTHRAVAKEADVPLGSTNYHFADKDELLLSAVELATDVERGVVAEILGSLPSETDLARRMAFLVEELTVRQRPQLVLDYELYLAARRRPALRDAAQRWLGDVGGVIRSYAPDELTGDVVDRICMGFLVESVVLDRPMQAAEVEPTFRRAIGG